MRRKTLTHLLVWGVSFLLLPACGGGGGGGYIPPPQAAAVPQQATPPPSNYTIEPGMKQNIGTIQNNMCQIHDKICLERLEKEGISQEQYYELMRMMNQMGGIMQEMGSRNYNQGLELYHRQQLEQIQRNLNGM
jgi:hypothetical protein